MRPATPNLCNRANSVFAPLGVVGCFIFLSGCSLLGSGSDKSEAEVVHKESCKFDLTQAAKVSGRDDADVIENVQFDPDCKVKIEFRQVTGDGVVEIENRGGLEVLEHSKTEGEDGQ